MIKMKGILPIIRENNGCDYHRIYLPLKYLGYDFKAFDEGPGIKTFDGVEILFFNRMPLDPIEKVLNYKKKYGFKIVVDIDDWWELNVNHILYPSWKKNRASDRIMECIKAADAVICTTERLVRKILPLNQNVHIIPNSLPFDEDQFTDKRNESEFTRFIYAGGTTHQWDLMLLNNPFKRLANEDLNAQFVLSGYDDGNEDSKQLWNKIEKNFTVNGRIKNYLRQRSLSVKTYMKLYENADVSMVPLETNIFTPYKSNLKVLEAGCKRIPVIVSDTPPYNDEPNKEVLMIAHNSRAWYDHIRYCSKNPNFVKEKGEKLGEYVRNNYDLRKANDYRNQLFQQLKTK